MLTSGFILGTKGKERQFLEKMCAKIENVCIQLEKMFSKCEKWCPKVKQMCPKLEKCVVNFKYIFVKSDYLIRIKSVQNFKFE